MFKKILDILKWPSAIAGAIGVIIGAYVYFESIPKRAEASTQVYADTVDYYFKRLEARFDYMDNSILRLQREFESQGRSIENLQKSYIEYVRKNTKNTDELYNVLKDFIEVKKNNSESSYYEIPYPIKRVPYQNLILSLNK